MSDDDHAYRQYQIDVADAYAERFRQAGFTAMDELRSELIRCCSHEQFTRWCDAVNELTDKIMGRPI